MWTEHSQKNTDNGIVDVYTFRKENEGEFFTEDEYTDILRDYLKKDNMVLERVYVQMMDYWGYQKSREITDIKDIDLIKQEDTINVDAWLSDDKKKYKLSMDFCASNKIKLEVISK